ncbi:MAG: hypothetical protein MJ175_03970, partial [Clostridia bacterium]|nr:hypothetical protein [Clostridia bacterium]
MLRGMFCLGLCCFRFWVQGTALWRGWDDLSGKDSFIAVDKFRCGWYNIIVSKEERSAKNQYRNDHKG